jgi:Flp pilus assembly protein TadG
MKLHEMIITPGQFMQTGSKRRLHINWRVAGRRRPAAGSDERGVQFVELAITLPILLMLLAGIAEFGNYFYAYTTLSRSTRSAARYITSKVFNDAEKAKARNLALCGNLDSCSSLPPQLSGLTLSNIEITTNGGSGSFPQTVKVRIVNYQYRSLLDLGKWTGGAWQNINVSPSTTMRYMLDN